MSQAEALKEKGIKLFQQYDYEAAAKVFREAEEAYRSENQPLVAAEMLVNLGLVHRALNEGQQAIDLMQQALTVFQEHEDAMRMAQTLGNLGGAYIKLNDKEQAYNAYRQAADIFEELGEKEMYGQTLLAMADLQMKDGKMMQGAATYQAGLENLENLTMNQRIIKGLQGTINRFSGAGSLPQSQPDKSDKDDE